MIVGSSHRRNAHITGSRRNALAHLTIQNLQHEQGLNQLASVCHTLVGPNSNTIVLQGGYMNSILETGFLRQKTQDSRKRALEYEINYLEEKHLPLLMQLQEVIVQNLARPDLLQSFSYDFMKRHLGPQGIVLGVFVQQRLVAFRNLYFPDPWDAEWNLGLDLGLPKEELGNVANLQMVCVHPDFRGNSLALKMNRLSIGLLREKGIHHHICATVSPYNIWNIPVLLSSGFRVARLKNKYGGKVRYIVHQDLRKPVHFDDQSTVHVRLDNLDTQQRWFDSGFYGVALKKRVDRDRKNPASGFDLVFKSPVSSHTAPFDMATPGWWHWPREMEDETVQNIYSAGHSK